MKSPNMPQKKVMLVTNPVDIITYLSFRESGFPRNRLFGMGNILDGMRFRTYIANELGVSREDTRALVIGEHGDSMVPLVEYASVSGIPITSLLSPEQINSIVNRTVTSGADVIKLKGSTFYAPRAVIALTADAIVTGRNSVMSVSTCLEGEYGTSDVSIGVPVVLGKDGVERIVELNLSEKTKEKFLTSVSAVKAAILFLNPNGSLVFYVALLVFNRILTRIKLKYNNVHPYRMDKSSKQGRGQTS